MPRCRRGRPSSARAERGAPDLARTRRSAAGPRRQRLAASTTRQGAAPDAVPRHSDSRANQPAWRLVRAIARQAAARTYLQRAPTSMAPVERARIRLGRVAIAAGRGWFDTSLDGDLAPEGSRIA